MGYDSTIGYIGMRPDVSNPDGWATIPDLGISSGSYSEYARSKESGSDSKQCKDTLGKPQLKESLMTHEDLTSGQSPMQERPAWPYQCFILHAILPSLGVPRQKQLHSTLTWCGWS
ncbi:hypothetical protein N7523_001243 [Penicillium sp. IBT 18751x]|nr:hypothetical protein N7523_001243 [Penicillium sp. IBT 18751x]